VQVEQVEQVELWIRNQMEILQQYFQLLHQQVEEVELQLVIMEDQVDQVVEEVEVNKSYNSICRWNRKYSAS
jgi:esterase/lipase